MNRRSFVIRGGLIGIALSLLPQFTIAQEQEFDMIELMGKADIELYGDGYDLRKEAHDAFVEMYQAALKEGIEIEVVSSYRSFERQAEIFESKYDRFTEEGLEPLAAIDKIIEYSTIPGTSRHHWGTEIDIVDKRGGKEGDVLVSEKFESGGPYSNLKAWMDKNANNYGFYLVYTDEPKRRGFKYEPWHYSYAPLSIPMLTKFRKKNIMHYLDKEDFEGLKHFTTGFIKTYITDNILDINPELL
ncbi:MAG: M15 family metallopeptidase [Flavobacteriaceae bacterium]